MTSHIIQHTLEVIKLGVTFSCKLIADPSARSTRSRSDNGRAATGDSEAAQILGNSGLVGEGGGLCSGAGELLEVDSASTGHGVAACDEVLGVGEEELERASRAGKRGGNVEVKDGGEGAVDAGEVLSTIGGVGVGGGDRDDEV